MLNSRKHMHTHKPEEDKLRSFKIFTGSKFSKVFQKYESVFHSLIIVAKVKENYLKVFSKNKLLFSKLFKDVF